MPALLQQKHIRNALSAKDHYVSPRVLTINVFAITGFAAKPYISD